MPLGFATIPQGEREEEYASRAPIHRKRRFAHQPRWRLAHSVRFQRIETRNARARNVPALPRHAIRQRVAGAINDCSDAGRR